MSNEFVPKSQKQLLHSNMKRGALSVAVGGLFFNSLSVNAVRATTFFDTDVYGDKELKIATVNKLKQKLRNAILANPTIASSFIKLAINDALGYDVTSRNGGADGSILFEMDLEQNKALEEAKDILKQVQKDLQRTNTLSFADVCAFSGSEALESVGCGRVTVQIGRYDVKEKNAKSTVVPWHKLSGDEVVRAFQGSGLDVRDAIILLSAIGETNRVIEETLASTKKSFEDDDEPFEPEPFVPSTFGARDDIFGAKLGKGDFGVTYVSLLLQGKRGVDDAIARSILAQPSAKAILGKYIGNDAVYKKDVSDIYARLTQIGEAYTTRNS